MSKTSDKVNKLIEECSNNGIKKLDLSSQRLDIFPVKCSVLKHLQFLYLERNDLEKLPDDFSQTFLHLKWLDIRHNKLKYLPNNIFMLKNLRNLLLEGNQLEQLPLELGLLTSLSGLNLAGNPLQIPPKDVVELGTKAVLKYLREHLAIEQRFGNMELEDGSHYNEEIREQLQSDGFVDDSMWSQESERTVNKSRTIDYASNRQRRHSLEEEQMLNSPPYSVQPLDIKERTKHEKEARRRRDNPSSAPPQRSSRKSKTKYPLTDKRQAQSDYLRRGTIESSHVRDVELAERRAFNDKVDTILQKKRDKTSLDDWRKKTRRLQSQKQRSSSKHEVKIPFANDLQQDNEQISKHAEDVKGILAKDKIARLRQLRDQQLEEKIREHAKHIREWRHKDKLNKMESDLKTAKENLEVALSLQRDLEEKRALQYRLRAFTAEDFVPKLHGDTNERKLDF